ncbi:hypothetical protein EUX98_g9202 [Antrodiella citrinella]|uniref:ATP-dependent DNA helicase n=1 Tax=Antrodiella citrinella TaxID=2447956 RepID=A0A4S4LY78_9APHY|nr:hypothetical protein EUX98_g9202 [Antrodiella citrinella]
MGDDDEEGINENEGEAHDVQVPITEEMMLQAKLRQGRDAERLHGEVAVDIGIERRVFHKDDNMEGVTYELARRATEADATKLQEWQAELRERVGLADLERRRPADSEGQEGDVGALMGLGEEGADVFTNEVAETALEAVEADNLLYDQRRAYNMVTWHVGEMLAGRDPPQLLMLVYGEGGTGKSMVVQAITEFFKSHGALHLLEKGAYTGMAASLIGGHTRHDKVRIGARSITDKVKSELTSVWRLVQYFTVDEISMVSQECLAKLSRHISVGKGSSTDAPFGGVSMMIAGDHQQFPPVAAKKRALLYVTNDSSSSDSTEDALGHAIMEQFDDVVILKEQIRVVDPVYLDILHAIRRSDIRREHEEQLLESTRDEGNKLIYFQRPEVVLYRATGRSMVLYTKENVLTTSIEMRIKG